MYSPEIKPEHVQKLYQLKLKTGKKMTHLVAEAIENYLKERSNEYGDIKRIVSHG